VKIELGSGWKPSPGYYCIDNQPLPGVNLIWDLEHSPIPLPDACCDEIRSSHVLEHIHNLIGLMNDCYRLLSVGGTFHAVIPQVCDTQGKWYASAFQDPTHVRYFVPNTWGYFIDGHPLYEFGMLYGIQSWELISFEDQGWVASLALRKPESAQSFPETGPHLKTKRQDVHEP